MGTSKLAKRGGAWVGGASIFSGRPDPVWPVDQRNAKKLERIWESLKPWAGDLPSRPVLGYRGCLLRDRQSREWFAYENLVSLKARNVVISRRDDNHQFEKLLLASAPRGVLPNSLIEGRKG
jgi:hypothetical protein